MKSGLISIIIGVLDFVILIWLNLRLTFLNRGIEDPFGPGYLGVGNIRLFIVGLGVLGLILAITGYKYHKRFSVIGFIISSVNIIISFFPLWEWVR